MVTEPAARRALEELDLVEGLSGREVRLRLGRLSRLGDLGQRGLAFYLLEMEERGLHQQKGNDSTAKWAQAKLELEPRRTRELLRAGRKLRLHSEVDRAFCRQEISWTKVLTLLRVVTPEHEHAWVEKAKAVSCQELRRAVLLAREDGAPRKPGDGKGTPEITYRESLLFGVMSHKKLELAKEKLTAELGRAVTTSELVDLALGIYVDMENDGESPGWTHVPSSLYRIVLRPWVEEGSKDLPLLVETEDGLLPIDGYAGQDVVSRMRTACACCDGEVVPDCDSDHRHDVPTPPGMRKRVLARDGHCCRCCGARGELHVHHIVFRSKRGRTRVWNLISLCVRCHSLVHAELLVIEGKTHKKARFVDSKGQPVHEPGRPAEPSVLLKIAAPDPRDPVEEVVLSNEAALDDVPEVIDGAWWQRHADLIQDRGTKGLELKAGRPALEVAEEDRSPECLSFDEAFEGIVGQDALLERIRIEAEGGRELGEPFPHTLFTGPPGTGKTTLARGIAGSQGARLVAATGPTLQDVHGLLCLLASLGEGDMLFLDEIHAVPRPVLETLYEAMAEGVVSLRFQAGSRTKTARLALPSFTLLAATTEPAELPEPLKTRFQLREHLGFYELDDLARLAGVSGTAKGFDVDPEAAETIAGHARGTPREALRLVERVLRFAAAKRQRRLTRALAKAALQALGYDEEGLTRDEQKVVGELRASRVPIPGRRLARSIGIDFRTLLDEIEPWLCRIGLVHVTPRGRIACPRSFVQGRAHAAEGAY